MIRTQLKNKNERRREKRLMNFLTQTLSSFTGGGIPYHFGQKRERDPSEPRTPWIIYEGTKKDDGTPVTIFSFDDKGPRLKSLALNAIRKIRSLKLPYILKVLDSNDAEQQLYFVTERVTPLIDVLNQNKLSIESRLLVIYSVATALKFLNVEGSSVLSYLTLNSIFVNSIGEVRLGGFELLTSLKDNDYNNVNSNDMDGFNETLPPELNSRGYEYVKSQNPEVLKVDSWRLASLIFKLFNLQSSVSNDQLSKATNIPKSLVTGYKNLIRTSPSLRSSVETFLKNGEKSYFNSKLINSYKDLEQFQLKTEEEKLFAFDAAQEVKNDTLPGFIENKILPEVVIFFNQYPSHSSASLNLILSLSENISKKTHSKLVKPVIIKAFALPDRSIRFMLLSTLPTYIEKLERSDVSDNIFPHFVSGFADSNPSIREETIKATLLIAPKLSDRQLNNDLLRFLAKTQTDEKPEIRTNTTILIGKIAEFLNKSSRASVLATAFSKGLKDSFLPSRIASILAISSCIEYFTPEIISNKILTVIAPSLLDKSSKVRNEAQKAFDLFFQKIKEEAAKLPLDKDDDKDDDTVQEISENVENFGLNISNVFNKFKGFSNNASNSELNILVPDSSRSGTPIANSSFDHKQSQPTIQQKTKINDSFNQSWDDSEDIDESWGIDEIETQDEISVPLSKPNLLRPKVTKLATSDSSIKSTSSIKTRKTLQLKPKSKLKLNLDFEEKVEDGWDDGW